MARPTEFLKVADAIRQRWINGPGIHPGSRLPTERVLMEFFGVSRSTVTRALARLVEEGLIETRRGSGAYVRRPDDGRGAPRLIGFVAPHIPQAEHLTLSFGLRIYHGVERRARELGYQALTACSNYDIEHEEGLIEQLVRIGAEAIVLQPVHYPTPRLGARAAQDYLAHRWPELPIVLVDLGFAQWRRSVVLFDNFRLGLEMTRALLEHDCRNIILMQTPADHLHNSLHDRRRGWQAALRRLGDGVPDAYDGWPGIPFTHVLSDDDADRLVEDLLALSPRPDALIAWEDRTAMQLIAALQRRGVRVPEDFRVVGFDNLDAGQSFEPAFPTSDPDFVRAGEVALDAIDGLLTGALTAPASFFLPVPILWREPEAPRTKGGFPLDAFGREARPAPVIDS